MSGHLCQFYGPQGHEQGLIRRVRNGIEIDRSVAVVASSSAWLVTLLLLLDEPDVLTITLHRQLGVLKVVDPRE